MALQRTLHEFQGRSIVALPCAEGLQDLTFVIHGTPQIMQLTMDVGYATLLVI